VAHYRQVGEVPPKRHTHFRGVCRDLLEVPVAKDAGEAAENGRSLDDCTSTRRASRPAAPATSCSPCTPWHSTR
jgi:hypothetical protein